MPTGERFASHNDQPQPDLLQLQDKFCSYCRLHITIPNPNTQFYLHDTDSVVVCNLCRTPVTSEGTPTRTPGSHELCVEVETELERRGVSNDNQNIHVSRRPVNGSGDLAIEPVASSPSGSSSSFEQGSSTSPSLSQRPAYPHHSTVKSTRSIPWTNTTSPPVALPRGAQPASRTERQIAPASPLDPLADFTRLRVRSQGHHCLFPGATFQGTQKSGRNSYDVNVTIVDVDFNSSFLCGYLRIRGLTDDWPELTTYFDAEIIGSRYGFLTQNWGATEQEDMVHWQRFPAFKRVRHDLKKPQLTISDRDCGAVFMRWKERFLVPDHRVQDINGASFAGFYYVCVDFNPPTTTSSRPSISHRMSSTGDDMETSQSPPLKSETPQRQGRRAASRHMSGRSPSSGPRAIPQTATMNGFYFHQNSEPYQQLSLNHIPERQSSSFEFR